MALNIRNPHAEKLAREISALCGENLTQAIIHALEEKLERVKGKKTAVDLVQEIMNISNRCSELPDYDQRSPDEILAYNENGAID